MWKGPSFLSRSKRSFHPAPRCGTKSAATAYILLSSPAMYQWNDYIVQNLIAEGGM